MTKRVGFIGLGAIGWPMAKHIAQAFDTTVWNRTVERGRDFADEFDAQRAPSVAALVEECAIVMTCLPTSREVDEVLRNAGYGWREGQLVIDATSGDPSSSRSTAAWLAERGVGFVDAPVSGGTSGAEAGTLTVMLGGEERWAEEAKQIVAPFAGKVVHVGPVGAGHALKAINNALLAVNVQAAGEGLAALVKLGVEARKALEVINASSGRSNVTENLVPERVVTRAWPRTFRLALLDKDVRIAVKVLKENGIPSEAIGMAQRVIRAAHEELGEEADHVEVIKLIERKAGVEIR